MDKRGSLIIQKFEVTESCIEAEVQIQPAVSQGFSNNANRAKHAFDASMNRLKKQKSVQEKTAVVSASFAASS